MNDKEIKKILENEVEILIIKKKSELSFLDTLFTDNFIINFLIFFKKRKYDYLIITRKRIVSINKNKLIENILYDFSKGMKFNSLTSEISFYDRDSKSNKIRFSFLRITYEEIQFIKNKIGNIGK